ncbi:MAG TPA: hypothetical protein VKG25_20840 [Bryobacteraceae bacterium]|nr:hypothetical protein [Bryobacteraceae bacterium]
MSRSNYMPHHPEPIPMHTFAEPEIAVPAADEALQRTFMLTLLLGGGVQQAEAAMLEAIRQTQREQLSNQELHRQSLKAAIAAGDELPQRSGTIEGMSLALPPELCRVLLLPAHLRHCFVLRMLARYSSEDCAELNVLDADEGACSAMKELARIRKAECRQGSLRNQVGLSPSAFLRPKHV